MNFVTFLIMINFFNLQINYIYAFIYCHFVCNSCFYRFIFIYKINVRENSQDSYWSSAWYTWIIRNFITHYIYIISAGRNSLYQHTAVRTGIFLRRRNVRNERSGQEISKDNCIHSHSDRHNRDILSYYLLVESMT